MTANDHSFDELASAYLDDEVTPDERALVDADRGLLDRVEEFRGLRAALSADAPLTDDSAIGAALAWFGADEPASVPDDGAVTPAAEAPPTPAVRSATSLDAVRRRRSGRLLALMAAAAAFAVVAVGVSKLASSDDKRSEMATADATTAKREAPAGASEAPSLSALDGPAEFPGAQASEATEAPAATEAAQDDTAAGSATALATGPAPAIDTPDQLIALVNQSRSTTVLASATPSPAASAAPAASMAPASTAAAAPVVPMGVCDVQGELLPQPIVWQGIPAGIYLRPDLAVPTEAVVVDALCNLLATVPLAP